MTDDACPHCGQPVRPERMGVRMSALKARILDAIRRGGRDGISTDDLRAMIWSGDSRSNNTLKSHVFQINELLSGTRYQIRNIDASPFGAGRYLLKRVVTEAAE